MVDTTFVDNSTVIVATWLNDVNDHVYNNTPISPATTVHPATVISNTPAGAIAATTVQAAINELDTEKQAVLVSGTNIKTVGGVSLLGTGDVAVGTGDVTGPASSVDSEIAVFNGITGKAVKSATTTGILKGTAGVLSAAVAGTDYLDPAAIGVTVQAYDADLTTWAGVTPGTGVATALAVNVGTAGSVVVNGGALGTPSGGTLTNCTGLPAAGVTGTAAILGANVFTGQQTFAEVKDTVYTITDGAAFEIDPANGSVQIVTLGANRTPAATNFEAGQVVILGIDDGTAYTITWTTVAPVWVTNGGGGAAPTLATTGYTWIKLWKVGSVIYAESAQP